MDRENASDPLGLLAVATAALLRATPHFGDWDGTEDGQAGGVSSCFGSRTQNRDDVQEIVEIRQFGKPSFSLCIHDRGNGRGKSEPFDLHTELREPMMNLAFFVTRSRNDEMNLQFSW